MITFLILFFFIFVDTDGKDVGNGKVYNTTDDSEAHGIEEKLRIGYDVLTNEKRVDLNNKTNFIKKSGQTTNLPVRPRSKPQCRPHQ